MTMRASVVMLAVLAPLMASAQESSEGVAEEAPSSSSSGQSWSAVGAHTAGRGQNQLEGSVGFPGAAAQYARGLLDELDVGARVSINYGVLGLTNHSLWANVGLQALVKYRIFESGKVSLGASFAPGFVFMFPPYVATNVALVLPLELRLGFAASNAIGVGVSLGLPMYVIFGYGAEQRGFAVPILMGLGGEYFLRSDVAVYADLRMGPTLFALRAYSAAFSVEGKLGVAWHF